MSYSALYTTATGQIVEVAETADLTAPSGSQSVYSGSADPDLHYIVSGALTDRPTVTTTYEFTIMPDGTDSVSLSVPSGTVITDLENSTSQTAAGADTLVFTSTTIGAFQILIDPPFPYRPALISIFVSNNQ